MLKRILTAVVCVPIFLGAMYLGGAIWALLIGALIAIGTYEFWRMMRNRDFYLALPAVYVAEVVMILAITVFPYFLPLAGGYWDTLAILTLFLLVFFQGVFTFPSLKPWEIALSFMALIYVGWSLSHLILLEKAAPILLLYLFVIIWASDSGAYFAGRICGRHKLAPSLSPKKTIEGAIGGIICAILLLYGVNMFLFAQGIIVAPFRIYEVILFATVVAIIGIVGDLAESMLKRIVDVKDSGNILPGHGGILDRFDSIILSAPVVYYLFILGIL